MSVVLTEIEIQEEKQQERSSTMLLNYHSGLNILRFTKTTPLPRSSLDKIRRYLLSATVYLRGTWALARPGCLCIPASGLLYLTALKTLISVPCIFGTFMCVPRRPQRNN